MLALPPQRDGTARQEQEQPGPPHATARTELCARIASARRGVPVEGPPLPSINLFTATRRGQPAFRAGQVKRTRASRSAILTPLCPPTTSMHDDTRPSMCPPPRAPSQFPASVGLSRRAGLTEVKFAFLPCVLCRLAAPSLPLPPPPSSPSLRNSTAQSK